MLTWIGAAKAEFFTQPEVDSLHELGLQLMQVITEVLPSRNVCIPWFEDRESEREEPSGFDSQFPDDSNEDARNGRKGAWNIPKFHAIAHIKKSIELFGRYLFLCETW